jgi:hypothetical protein
MPSFAGRLSDHQIADIANYVRTSWGNRAAPNATWEMVASWRSVANIPAYGTQAAASFECPQVGGGPGATGPDPQAVAGLTTMLKGGDRKIAELIAEYRKYAPDAGPTKVADGLLAAYCPVVAGSKAPTYQKFTELRRFAIEAEADASSPTALGTVPQLDVIWAVPVGHTLVYRSPRQFAGKLVCPANDGKLIPQDLVAKATTLLGKLKLPVPGASANQLAVDFATQNLKAAPADLANALTTAYCSAVISDTGVEQAVQRAWLTDFSAQVIQALQSRTTAANR